MNQRALFLATSLAASAFFVLGCGVQQCKCAEMNPKGKAIAHDAPPEGHHTDLVEPGSTEHAPKVAPKIRTLEDVEKDAPREKCRLERWEDGDTPYIDCPSGKTPLRLLAIDTPESGFDKNALRRAEYQSKLWSITADEVIACGKVATEYSKSICPAGSEIEVVGRELDRYKRRLGYLVCKGKNVNEELVKSGHAGVYAFPAHPEKPSGCPLK